MVSYSYNTWGVITGITGSAAQTVGRLNPLRYRGYVYDDETGLYYLQSRYYDPRVGRFINADGKMPSVGGDVIGYYLFAYCGNNPVNNADYNGKMLLEVFTVLYGVIKSICKGKNELIGMKQTTEMTMVNKDIVSHGISDLISEKIRIKKTKKISESSIKNPYTVYSKTDITDSCSSSVGYKPKIFNVSSSFNFSLNDIGQHYEYSSDGKTYGTYVGLDLTSLSIKSGIYCGFENDDETLTIYAESDVSLWMIICAYCLITTGQPCPQPAFN